LVGFASLINGSVDICICLFVIERFDKNCFAFIFGLIYTFEAVGVLISNIWINKNILHQATG